MRVGLAYVLAEPVVYSTLIRSAAFYGCASAIWALLPLYVRHVLGLSSASFGVMMGVIGAGAVLGGLMMPLLRKWIPRNNLITLAGVACGLALVPLALIPSTMTAYPALLVFGIGWIVGASNLQATVQLAAAPWVRARALALYQAMYNGGMGLGALLWGLLGEHAGLTGTILAAGLAGCVIALLTRAVELPAEIGDPSAPALDVSRTSLDRGGDGAASAQRPASAGARDQVPHRSRQRCGVSRRHGGSPAIPTSVRCGGLDIVA